jgi:DNA-binding ferritin-like protein
MNNEEIKKEIEESKKMIETAKKTSDIAQNRGDERMFHLAAETIRLTTKYIMILEKKLK